MMYLIINTTVVLVYAHERRYNTNYYSFYVTPTPTIILYSVFINNKYL